MKPENFAEQDLTQLLGEAMLFGSDGMIERQEKIGQQQLVNSTVLPKDNSQDWEVLKRWGVKRGQEVDALFCEAKLPKGWSTVSTNHAMWSNLLDARGLRRAEIFYKASFYDRKAFIRVNSRFSGGEDHDACFGDPTMFACPIIQDNGLGRIVYRFKPVYTACLKENQFVAGVILGDIFLYAPKEESSASVFTRQRPASDAIPIAESSFSDHFQSEEEWSAAYDAARELAFAKSNEFLASLPSDDTIWSERYDMPEA